MAGGEEEEALAVGAELERDGLGDAGDGGRGEGPALVLRGVEELDLGGAGRGVGRGDRKDAAGGVEGRERPRRPARGRRGARHVHDALARALAQVPQAHRVVLVARRRQQVALWRQRHVLHRPLVPCNVFTNCAHFNVFLPVLCVLKERRRKGKKDKEKESITHFTTFFRFFLCES